MDAFSDDNLERIIVKSSAQVGKSEILLNVAGYFIQHDPCPMILVQPSLDLAADFSKDRLTPMIEDSPGLRKRVTKASSRQSGNTLLHKKFRGGRITLSGANSPRSLAGRPVRIVLLDERAGYENSAGDEGDPAALARKRANNFFNRKIGEFSTPTIKGICPIEAAWEESDQRLFYMPCPHCEKPVTFSFNFKRFKWEKDKPKTVVFLCTNCDAIIEEKEKHQMMRKGVWIAQLPTEKTAGFHLNEFLSPWRKWSEIIEEWIRVNKKKNPNELKVFVNTALGETFEQKGDSPDHERLYERREVFPAAAVPVDGVFLTAFADVQGNRIEYEVRAWGRNLESWSIEYEVLEGNVSESKVWNELEKILSKKWKTPLGYELPIRMLGVDSGAYTQTVYKWVNKFPRNRVIATKGNPNLQVAIRRPKISKVKVLCPVWHIGVNVLKTELYGFLKLAMPAKGDPFPHGYIHFPDGYDQEYFKMLTAEHLVLTKDKKGYSVYTYEKKFERNEALDIAVGNRAVAAALGIDGMSDKNWDALSHRVAPAVSDTAQPREKPKERKQRRKPASDFWNS